MYSDGARDRGVAAEEHRRIRLLQRRPAPIRARAVVRWGPREILRPDAQGLLLTTTRDAGGTEHKTLFAAFSVTNEDDPTSHGWIIAFDVDAFRQTAAWCATPHGGGCGIWQGAPRCMPWAEQVCLAYSQRSCSEAT